MCFCGVIFEQLQAPPESSLSCSVLMVAEGISVSCFPGPTESPFESTVSSTVMCLYRNSRIGVLLPGFDTTDLHTYSMGSSIRIHIVTIFTRTRVSKYQGGGNAIGMEYSEGSIIIIASRSAFSDAFHPLGCISSDSSIPIVIMAGRSCCTGCLCETQTVYQGQETAQSHTGLPGDHGTH